MEIGEENNIALERSDGIEFSIWISVDVFLT